MTTKDQLSQQLLEPLRAMRARYDKLPRGDSAPLRRCRTAHDVEMEGVFWRIVGATKPIPNLAHVALLFPLAPQRSSAAFSFGRFLRGKIGDSSGAALRFRRLLDSRDRDDLDHRLRGMLRLACADGTAVDWGALGTDILWFFGERGSVRRRWAQDFYAPGPRQAPQTTTATTPGT
jgi:CRISPR type I-E-associated protein CasB/Cse2